jgi:hypothetical protein
MHVCLILQATLEVSMYELAGELVKETLHSRRCVILVYGLDFVFLLNYLLMIASYY